MTYKDMVALLVFIVVLFSMLFIFVYLNNQKPTVAIDFIELPESVNINPELK